MLNTNRLTTHVFLNYTRVSNYTRVHSTTHVFQGTMKVLLVVSLLVSMTTALKCYEKAAVAVPADDAKQVGPN